MKLYLNSLFQFLNIHHYIFSNLKNIVSKQHSFSLRLISLKFNNLDYDYAKIKFTPALNSLEKKQILFLFLQNLYFLNFRKSLNFFSMYLFFEMYPFF